MIEGQSPIRWLNIALFKQARGLPKRCYFVFWLILKQTLRLCRNFFAAEPQPYDHTSRCPATIKLRIKRGGIPKGEPGVTPNPNFQIALV